MASHIRATNRPWMADSAMIRVTTDGADLVVDGNRRSLPAEIESTVQVPDTVVVLLDPDGAVPPGRNVWGFDTDGALRWKAEAVRAPSGDVNCYVELWTEGTEIWTADWKGMTYRIDPDRGTHVDRTLRK